MFGWSDLWLLTQPVKADADGRYELFLPPGPINLRLTRYVDGDSDATSWLPREKSGTLGPLHEIPARQEFGLPTIDLVRMLPIQGQLIDQNDKPLADDDWTVYGYPLIPGEESRFVMNSMAGVQTDDEGRFEGSYPELSRQQYSHLFLRGEDTITGCGMDTGFSYISLRVQLFVALWPAEKEKTSDEHCRGTNSSDVRLKFAMSSSPLSSNLRHMS